ncbi:MAG: hypothetical protein S4CHLAM45_11090 [Chlamydiales bacterium]|nr:hypothetical protein [Chlamydiales bacterium]MCH9619601.1 hypothetical protein [Chlamydiales bacterium]MCH9623207.1 hypothetical protein [Chlamydiales bacterium]
MMNEEDEIPQTEENKIPLFLHITYIVVIVFGIIAFFLYWNGSHGFLDRGYWEPLQRVADTTYPFEKEGRYLSE